MPGWEETENEIRYRIRDPDLFSPDTFFVKDMQKEPRNYGVFGRLKGEESSKLQALRFPKDKWSMDEAKKWYEERKEELNKSMFEAVPEDAKYAGVAMDAFEKQEAEKAKSACKKSEEEAVQKAEVDMLFLEKANLMVQSLSFAMSDFTEKAVKEWLASKNMDVANLKKGPEAWTIDVRPEANFIPGSLRDIILRQGIKSSVGLLKKEQISKKVPDRFTITAAALADLFDLDVTEVTLTRAPIVGKMAEFRVIKSVEAKPEGTEEYSACVPILKVSSDELQRVGAYVLVPNLPDWVGDMVTMDEIEAAAHRFMKNLAFKMAQGTGSGLEHLQFEGVGYPIESFVDRTGVYGVIGGWWLETQVTNQEAWAKIKKGEIVGYSIGGYGRRKKISVSNDGPIAKTNKAEVEKSQSQDMADIIVGAISKLFGFGKNEPAQVPIVKKDVEKKEEQDMKLELLQKYDLKPSEAEAIEKSGVNLEEALSGAEKLFKAVNLNFSMEGIGYTTKKLIDIVRRGEFGEYASGSAWSAQTMKSQPVQTPAQTPAPSAPETTQVAKGEDTEGIKKSISDMSTAMQSMVTAVEAIAGRLEVVEKAKGIRKSVDSDAFDIPSQQASQSNGVAFDAVDRHNLSYRKNKQVLKEQGLAL